MRLFLILSEQIYFHLHMQAVCDTQTTSCPDNIPFFLQTMVVGLLVAMVKEKVSSYILDWYEVMKGMGTQHKILK